MPELFARQSIQVDAPPERVWEVVTTPSYTRQFMFGCDAISDWQPGAMLDWVGASNGVVYVHGEIVEIDPPKRLVYTTIDPNSPDFEDVPENYLTVTMVLTPADGGTRIDVEQGDFAKVAQGQRRYDEGVNTGWESALAGIKRLAEGS